VKQLIPGEKGKVVKAYVLKAKNKKTKKGAVNQHSA